MATERLTVLAGAAALGEFTAPELAAYTGANANTVRQVLQREQKRHGFFERVESRGRPSGGRPAVLWRLTDEQRAKILDEISNEDNKISSLRVAVDDDSARDSLTDPVQRAAMFVASAEEAIARSYEDADNSDRHTLASIALNLLRAANPYISEHQQVDTEWWERAPTKPQSEFPASLETVSRVSLESQLKTVVRSPKASGQEELLRSRAHRVAAFAALSVQLAEGRSVEDAALTEAAKSISAGSEILPVPQTLGWIKIFVDISIRSGNPAPVAVLAKSQETPEKFFPVGVGRGTWSEVSPPAELAGTGYTIWVESWAEALLTYSLIPGIVVSHDNTPESNETLARVMRETEQFRLGRAIVVASTTTIDAKVLASVSSNGGFYYPIFYAPLEGLLHTVNRAVLQTLSSIPNLRITYSLATDIRQREAVPKFVSTPALEAFHALRGVAVRSSDLELAQRTLAVFDDAVTEYRAVEAGRTEHEQDEVYASLVQRVADQLSHLGDSRRALSVAGEVIGSCRTIIDYEPLVTPPRKSLESARRRLAEIEQNEEVASNLAWAYELLSAEPDKSE